MTAKDQSDKEKMRIKCHRCNGQMASEKFYGEDNVFFGWHCVTCGEILDPVILLHRLSKNADIAIPENEEEIISLIQKYKGARPQNRMNSKSS
jgi:hypothetical protein